MPAAKTDRPESDWEQLPSLVLEQIFSLLSLRERASASLVCRRWHSVCFGSARIWAEFEFSERTLCRRRFSMYKGYQREFDHEKAKRCLKSVGHYFRTLCLRPTLDFYRLNEFLVMLSSFLTFFDDYPMPLLQQFEFYFACAINGPNTRHHLAQMNANPELFGRDPIIFGTGGRLFDQLLELLAALDAIEDVRLHNLLLVEEDAARLLEPLVEHNAHSLRSLSLMNCSKNSFNFNLVSSFVNLRRLVISPVNLSTEFLLVLSTAPLPMLTELHVVQDLYSSAPGEQSIVERDTWRAVRAMRPELRVRLLLQMPQSSAYVTESELLLQAGAPVDQLVYSAPLAALHAAVVLQVCEMYADSLCIYAHLGLPRVAGKRKFGERVDSLLLLLARSCRLLCTLVIRDRISTASLMLIALALHQNRCPDAQRCRHLELAVEAARECAQSQSDDEPLVQLERSDPIDKSERVYLVVRRNALLKRADWPRAPEWSAEFYASLKSVARDYSRTERVVGRLLGWRSWRTLSDREFKLVRL